jgi:hypothetical protein
MTQRLFQFRDCALLLVCVLGCGEEPLSAPTQRAVESPPTNLEVQPNTAPQPGRITPQPGAIAPHPGGQSGGEGATPCEGTEQLLAAAMGDGVQLEDILSDLQHVLTGKLGLQWWPKNAERAPGPRTGLIVSGVRMGEVMMMDCSQLTTMIEFDARSEDTQLAGHFAGVLSGYIAADTSLRILVGLTSGQLGDAPTHLSIPPDPIVTMSLNWRVWDPDMVFGTLDAFGETIAHISSGELATWQPTPLGPPAVVPAVVHEVQQQLCGSTAPAGAPLATFESDAALMAATAKRWVVCSGQTNLDPSFAGIEIDATGHWRELRLSNGELIVPAGFGHEGQIIRNVYAADEFNVAFLDWLPQRYSFFNAGISADGQTLRLDNQVGDEVVIQATFHVSELPVRPPPAAFEKGARAGQAACAMPESDLTSRPASITAVRQLLVGRWTFCSGQLGTDHPGISFGADDTFHFLEADGSDSAEGGTFEILDTSSQNGPGAYQIDLQTDKREYMISMPIFANTPLKFMANDECKSVLSAM